MANYSVKMATYPGGQVIGEYGEYYRAEKAEAVAKHESRAYGPNVLALVERTSPDLPLKVTAYRCGRQYKP